MKAALLAALLVGCASPEYHCKAGYAFTYSYGQGYRQVWSEGGGGVPCKKMPLMERGEQGR